MNNQIYYNLRDIPDNVWEKLSPTAPLFTQDNDNELENWSLTRRWHRLHFTPKPPKENKKEIIQPLDKKVFPINNVHEANVSETKQSCKCLKHQLKCNIIRSCLVDDICRIIDSRKEIKLGDRVIIFHTLTQSWKLAVVAENNSRYLSRSRIRYKLLKKTDPQLSYLSKRLHIFATSCRTRNSKTKWPEHVYALECANVKTHLYGIE